MTQDAYPEIRAELNAEIEETGGILRLDPAYVARDWIPEGQRMVVPDGQYDVGERGTLSERWLGSTTMADNVLGPDDEGLSWLRLRSGDRILLRDAVAADFPAIAGKAYAETHPGLGRLAKVFDYQARVPLHIHPPAAEAAKVGCNPKDEAYYFPPQDDKGPHPETFLGLHTRFAAGDAGGELLAELKAWDSDDVLRFSKAYQQIAEEGFFVPSGVVHGPGTALTIELQEDSDALAMMQGVNSGRSVDKRLLYKDILESEKDALAEAAVLQWIDWELNADPHLYEKLHFLPAGIVDSAGAQESWIFQGTRKFSGKRLRIEPGASYVCDENGVFNLFMIEGKGTIGGVRVEAGQPGDDELLVVHERAIQDLEYVNTGSVPMLLVKFFGPDLNPDSPLVGLDTLQGNGNAQP